MPQLTKDIKCIPADVAIEIDGLPSKARRAALRAANAMADALRDEVGE